MTRCSLSVGHVCDFLPMSIEREEKSDFMVGKPNTTSSQLMRVHVNMDKPQWQALPFGERMKMVLDLWDLPSQNTLPSCNHEKKLTTPNSGTFYKIPDQ